MKKPANPLGQEVGAEIENKVHPLTLWIKIGHKNAAAASATAVVDSADACCGLATAVLSRCVIITDFVAGFPNGCCGLGSGPLRTRPRSATESATLPILATDLQPIINGFGVLSLN